MLFKLIAKYRLIYFTIFLMFFFVIISDDTTYKSYKSLNPNNSLWKAYGRIARSKSHGVFSDGALMGFCYEDKRNLNTQFDTIVNDNRQKNYFYLQGNCDNFHTYQSHPGLPAFLFSLLDKVLKSDLAYYLITASITSTLLTLILFWLGNYIGSTAIILSAISFTQLNWLMSYGDNFGLFYAMVFLPMIVIAFLTKSKRRNLLFLGSLLATFTTLLCSGAEYLTCVYGMSFIPIIFYYIKNQWSFRYVLKISSHVASGIVVANFMALTVLVLQITSIKGIQGAKEHFFYTLAKRLHGGLWDNFLPSYAKPLSNHYAFHAEKLRLDVFKDYLYYDSAVANYEISFLSLFCFILIIVIISLLTYYFTKKRTLLALLICTVVGFIISASWILIFSPHASAHPFQDPLVWHFPFIILSIVLCSFLLSDLSNRIFKKICS